MNKIDFSFWGILKSLAYIIASFYSWLDKTGVESHIINVLAIFMVMDMLLGVWKAKRVKDLPNPSSSEAKKGIVTKCVMFVIPVVCGLIWSLFDKENVFRVINTSLTALAIAEGYSVIGNAAAVYTGKTITEFDAITFIFKSISSIIKEALVKTLEILKKKL